SAAMLSRMSRLDRRVRGDKAKLTADRVSYMVHPDWVCDPARAVPAAIWTPRVPTRPGLKGTARWYREQGLL
ncbi:MAG: NAD(P)-dependent oxidoreductase, partial [Sphingomonadaceae bacterium]|nr:NAD(P)-dependent oxidoreductase [Sphingomonadaceae bacterium]